MNTDSALLALIANMQATIMTQQATIQELLTDRGQTPTEDALD